MIQYLVRVPASLPANRAIVHNNVRAQRLGSNGFRAWLVPEASAWTLAVCRCGWAPHLGIHYRRTS